MKEMMTKTVKELRDIAKELNIKGRWEMTKAELVKAIELANVDAQLQELNKEEETKTTLDYLEHIQEGTLVAFKRSKDKDIAMSGKFVCFEKGKVIVESRKGTRYTLPPEAIIWVKTGSRWPKWVYSLFNNAQEVESDNAIS